MKNILILITLLSFLSCQKDSVNESENIHIRKGVWNWDNGPHEYKFRNVSADAGFVASFPREAIQAELPENVLDSADIHYWIYTSVDAAELAMVERLDMSNLLMHNIIDSPLSEGQIGDNCWHQLLVGAIQFIRNNVFVYITPNINLSCQPFNSRRINRRIIYNIRRN